LNARENRNVFNLDLNVPSESLSLTVLGRVPGGWSRTEECTLDKCCTGEQFGKSSSRGRA